MRHSAFKITALLGIVCAGFWAILQAQNGSTGLNFLKQGETKQTVDDSLAKPNSLGKSNSKIVQTPKKDKFQQVDPFAEIEQGNKVETASFNMNEKFSTEDDPFFNKEPAKKEVLLADSSEEQKNGFSRGLDFREEKDEPTFPQAGKAATKTELPPWKGEEGNNDNTKSSNDSFNGFDDPEEEPAETAKATEQPRLLFPEPKDNKPVRLTIPPTAKAIPKRNAAGPQLVGLPKEEIGKENDDPFGENSAFGKAPVKTETSPKEMVEEKVDDPFGGFEEKEIETVPLKLPLEIPDENEEKITPLNLQLEEPATRINQPDRSRFSPEAIKRTPAITPSKDLSGDGIISSKAIPRGAGHPQLSIQKVAPKNATLGEPMVYKIVVKNTGSNIARKVTVEDHIPKGTKLTGTIPRAEMTEKRLLWRMGTMKPGEEKTIQVKVIPTSAGQIGSVAQVNFVSQVAAETTVTAPKLKMTLTGPASTTVGEQVVYKFRLTNNGTAAAENVIIRNLIPKELVHPDGDDLEYEVGTLGAGKTEEIKLSVTATKEGQVINKAIATAKGGFKDEATSALRIDGPILSITRSGPKHRYLGRSAIFHNNLKNESRTTIQQTTVEESVPHGFRFKDASAGGRYNAQTGKITWSVQNLKPGETRKLSARLIGDSEGKRTSIVKAFARDLLRAEVQSATVVAGYPMLQTTIEGADKPVATGENITYQIRVNNKGTAQAKDVRVSLSVPQQLQFVSAKGVSVKQLANGNIQVSASQDISAKNGFVFYATFKAVSEGKGAVGVHAQGSHMSRPLTHEEEVSVYED